MPIKKDDKLYKRVKNSYKMSIINQFMQFDYTLQELNTIESLLTYLYTQDYDLLDESIKALLNDKSSIFRLPTEEELYDTYKSLFVEEK